MLLTMLGVGNGFSPGVYDNNALIEDGGECALVDCGTTAWWSLNALGRNREEIGAIFLTHLHFDHSGGVESAALYGKYVQGKKPRLIVPRPIADTLWDHVLRGAIENRLAGLCSLADYFQVESPEEGERFRLCGAVSGRWFHTPHIEGKFSCGLVLDERIVYTSDMVCDLPRLEEVLAEPEAILHDCQLRSAQVHADFETLKTYPEALRRKMLLMHHGLKETDAIPDTAGMRFLFQHRTVEL